MGKRAWLHGNSEQEGQVGRTVRGVHGTQIRYGESQVAAWMYLRLRVHLPNAVGCTALHWWSVRSATSLGDRRLSGGFAEPWSDAKPECETEPYIVPLLLALKRR